MHALCPPLTDRLTLPGPRSRARPPPQIPELLLDGKHLRSLLSQVVRRKFAGSKQLYLSMHSIGGGASTDAALVLSDILITSLFELLPGASLLGLLAAGICAAHHSRRSLHNHSARCPRATKPLSRCPVPPLLPPSSGRPPNTPARHRAAGGQAQGFLEADRVPAEWSGRQDGGACMLGLEAPLLHRACALRSAGVALR